MSLKETLARIGAAVESFDDEPPAAEPVFDPVHVGGVLVGALAAAGGLYWLLWTLLVFEGGLFSKASPLLRLALGRATLAQLGYEGPWNRGPFEGWAGNLAAAVLAVAAAAALRSEWRRAAKAARGRR